MTHNWRHLYAACVVLNFIFKFHKPFSSTHTLNFNVRFCYSWYSWRFDSSRHLGRHIFINLSHKWNNAINISFGFYIVHNTDDFPFAYVGLSSIFKCHLNTISTFPFNVFFCESLLSFINIMSMWLILILF